MSEPGAMRNEAQVGFKAAAAYDAGRPSYSPEVVERLLKHVGVSGIRHAKILDLAAGTGKFTEALVARQEEYEIVALEPHDDMRAQLEQKNLKKVTVIKGTAEHMDGVADGQFDAVIAAQSFHWFATMNALKEIARVLKPAGSLGMVWNIDDYNSPRSWDVHAGWDSEVRELVWTLSDDQPRFRHERWKSVFDEQTGGNPLTSLFSDPLFGLPIAEETVPYKVWLTRADLWHRLQTLSQVAILDSKKLTEFKTICNNAVDSEGTEVDGEKIALHGRTLLAWASRIPEAPLRSGG